MNRTGWLIFLIVQAVGEVCVWTAERFLSAVGPTLWVIGTLLLLPGDFMGAFIVEKMLWKSGLTMAQLTILQVPMSLAINAAFWFLCAKLLSLFVAHPSSQSDL